MTSVAQLPSAHISTTRITALTPRNFAEAIQFADMMARSTMVPDAFRNKPENILLAIQWGNELGLGPLQAMQSIAIINGRPAVYGDAMLAMVRGAAVCDDVIEHFEGDGDQLTAICEARRHGKAPVIARFSMADAKRAGLAGKSGPWTQYPRRMLQWRARGFALRDAFPDVLRGVISAEEAGDTPRRMVDVTPTGPMGDPRPLAADLEAFAEAGPPAIDAGVLDNEARDAAQKGRDAFIAWWQACPLDRRDAIRAMMPEYQALAARADAAKDEDPFGLPPAPAAAPNSEAGAQDGKENARASDGPPASEPSPRDEDFWAHPSLTLGAAMDPQKFQAKMHARIREARTWGEILALRNDNGDTIDTLPRAYRDDVLGELMDREVELRALDPAQA